MIYCDNCQCDSHIDHTLHIIQFPSPALFLTPMAPFTCSQGVRPRPVYVASPTKGQKISAQQKAKGVKGREKAHSKSTAAAEASESQRDAYSTMQCPLPSPPKHSSKVPRKTTRKWPLFNPSSGNEHEGHTAPSEDVKMNPKSYSGAEDVTSSTPEHSTSDDVASEAASSLEAEQGKKHSSKMTVDNLRDQLMAEEEDRAMGDNSEAPVAGSKKRCHQGIDDSVGSSHPE